WKKMKKAGKRLFQKLGELRDTQVMMEWVENFDSKDASLTKDIFVARALPPAIHSRASEAPSEVSSASSPTRPDYVADDPVSHVLREILAHREVEQKREAQAALE